MGARRGDGTLTGRLFFRLIVPHASDSEQSAAPEKVRHRTIPDTGQSCTTDAELFPTTDAEENRALSRTSEEDPSKERDAAQPKNQASQGVHGTPTLCSSRDIKRKARTSPDPRHTPTIKAYVEEYERHHPQLRAPVEASDHKQLSALLRRQPLASLETVIGWLHNAFESDDTPPLRRGFRLREFCSHAEKYANGPLRRAAGPTWVRSRDRSRKEISDAPNKFNGIQPIA